MVTAEGASWAPAVDAAGRSTLLLASERGQTDVALELLARGAAADAADDAGWTPLMWAAVHGNGALASALLVRVERFRFALIIAWIFKRKASGWCRQGRGGAQGK